MNISSLLLTGQKWRAVSFSLVFTLIVSFRGYSQDQCMPVGWATQNGGTTGGGNVTPVTVTTLSALQAQANSSGAKVIYVAGTMGAGVGTRVTVSSDKTIFGLPGATLNGGFDVKDANNVIIRNMIIKGPGAIDVDGVDCMTVQNSTNVWVDHCDISDGQDGNLDIVNGSNYITITWTKFHYTNASVEHQFCNLIGNSDSKTSDRGKLKVTMMFNYWTAGCVERMPRVRFGQVHVVNNLFDSDDANHGVRAGIEADLRVEKNAFIGINKPIDLYENNFTAVTATGNLFSGTSGNTVGSGTAFTPPYTLSTIPAANVEATVKPCVGATLTTPSVCPCGTPLPVKLLSFDAIMKETGDCLLEWVVANSETLATIVVEYSFNGQNFNSLATMGNNSNSYSVSKEIDHSSVYFRLKLIETNGDVSYSMIRGVIQEKQALVYPNPCNEQIWIQGITQGEVTIYATTGQKMMECKIQSDGVIKLDLLPEGTYILSIADYQQQKVIQKIMVKI